MVKLTSAFNKLKPCKIILVGDFFLDTYTIGKIRRISPEAPVPVLNVEDEHSIAGGAGNAVLNSLSLGAEIFAVGRLGNDKAGEELKKSLDDAGADTSGLVVEEGYQTPVKNRIIAENQQIIRVDHEKVTPLPELLQQQVIDIISNRLPEVSALVISDYAKGFFSPKLLQAIISKANKHGVCVIVDPKGIDFTKYAHSDIIKPNYSEAIAAANVAVGTPIKEIAQKLFAITQAKHIIITRANKGITLFSKDNTEQHFPVKAREVKDVTGAGDTVLATISVAISSGLDVSEAIPLANITAGLVIKHMGCARVTLPELATRLLQIDCNNKVFDTDHIFALQQALNTTPYNILTIDSQTGFSTELFKTIQKLSVNKENKLLVHIQDNPPSEEFISLISSLSEVDFIVLQNDKIEKLQLNPLEKYEIKN